MLQFAPKGPYYLPNRDDVEIRSLKFIIPVRNGFTSKEVACVAKGPFLADFVWDHEAEAYYCDRLYLKKGKIRLDDVPGFKHLVDGASWWAEENNIGNGEWEAADNASLPPRAIYRSEG